MPVPGVPRACVRVPILLLLASMEKAAAAPRPPGKNKILLLLEPCAASQAVVYIKEGHLRRLPAHIVETTVRAQSINHNTTQPCIVDKSPPGIQARERTIFCVCSSVARSRAAVRARTVRPRGWWAENKLPRVDVNLVESPFFWSKPPKLS